MHTIKIGNDNTMWLILLPIILVAFIYFKLVQNYSYWSKKGVAQLQPWPILGTAGPAVFGIRSFTEVMQDLYNSVPDKRYCGMYTFLRPTLMIRCPDLVKSLTVREFDTFPEHRVVLPRDADPLYTDNLFTMQGGQRWRECRSMLTPCLTSSKLKIWFELMLPHSARFMLHLEKHEGPAGVNILDAISRYSNDVICSVVLGAACNSFKDRENVFYLMRNAALKMMPWKSFNGFFNSISPVIPQILRQRKISARVDKFFRTYIMDYIKLAENNGNNQHDVINLLINARKKSRNVLADEEMIKHVFSFYLAGLSNSISAMCYTIYELALMPDIQEKLQMEIDDTAELSYSSILHMKYLDMVISESLRKWPPVTCIDRRSIKPFTIEARAPGERPLHLEAGTELWIPIYSLHRDPAYYPEPEKFDPERFNNTNYKSLNQLAYLPFGTGPRNCIGSRFALLKVKLMIFIIYRKYDIVPIKKTPIPLVFNASTLSGTPKGEFWFELKPRNI